MARGTDFGLNKGHMVTTIPKKQRRKRPSRRKGKQGRRTLLVRQIVRSVVGYAPYEVRLKELLKTGNAKDSKKALRLAKRKLGTHQRGMRKRNEIQNLVQMEKMAQEQEKDAQKKQEQQKETKE